jgi:5-methylcytosine-specific restriction endonuclease McrA
MGLTNDDRRVIRDDLIQAQGNRCYYCRRVFLARQHWTDDCWHSLQPTLDHLKPRSLGGKDRRENFVAACVACNRAKSSMPVDLFLWLLALAHNDPKGVPSMRGKYVALRPK